MATSGTISKTFSTGYTYQIAWSSTQSASSNSSTITCTHKLVCASGYDLYIGSRSNSCTVDGTKKTFSSGSISTSGNTTITLGTTTHTVTHGTDGSKSCSISGTFNIQATLSGSYVSSVTASSTVTLPTIAAKSTLSVANGTLGTSQTLTVTQQSTSYTHTIVAKCGSNSSTICTKSSSTSLTFTPPLTWASVNTSGTSVSVTYTITTYNGSTSLGSNSYSKTCTIPSSAAPTVTIAASDGAGYYSTWGAYILGKSTVKATITATPKYSTTIAGYANTLSDGQNVANSSSFTSSTLKKSGSITVTSKVTDMRGFSTTATKSITVAAYAIPQLSSYSVYRSSDTSGTQDSSGAYLTVKYTCKYYCTINSKTNSLTRTIKYKTSSASSYTSVTLTSSTTNASISASGTSGLITETVTYTFSATTTSSYDIVISCKDSFSTASAALVGPTVAAFMSWRTNKDGIAFGKVATKSKVLESAWRIHLNGVTQPTFYASASSGDVRYQATRTDTGASVSLQVGSGGANHGIYSHSTDKWIVYSDGTNIHLGPNTVGSSTTPIYLKNGVPTESYPATLLSSSGWYGLRVANALAPYYTMSSRYTATVNLAKNKTGNGSIYRSDAQSLSFPYTFAEAPAVTITPQCDSCIVGVTIVSVSTSKVTYWLFTSNTSATSVSVTVHARVEGYTA